MLSASQKLIIKTILRYKKNENMTILKSTCICLHDMNPLLYDDVMRLCGLVIYHPYFDNTVLSLFIKNNCYSDALVMSWVVSAIEDDVKLDFYLDLLFGMCYFKTLKFYNVRSKFHIYEDEEFDETRNYYEQDLTRAQNEVETCSICLVNRKDIIFQPCNHIISCTECCISLFLTHRSTTGNLLPNCAMCRSPIENAEKVYI